MAAAAASPSMRFNIAPTGELTTEQAEADVKNNPLSKRAELYSRAVKELGQYASLQVWFSRDPIKKYAELAFPTKEATTTMMASAGKATLQPLPLLQVPQNTALGGDT